MKPLQSVPLKKIRGDGTQARAGYNEPFARDIAAAIKNGDTVEPIDLFFDGGEIYWIGDGHHRYGGAGMAGEKHILARVHKGGQAEALLFNVKSNAAHEGNAQYWGDKDKRHAAELLLKTFPDMETAEIVGMARCSKRLVQVIRNELKAHNALSDHIAPASGMDDATREALERLPPEEQARVLREWEEQMTQAQPAEEKPDREICPTCGRKMPLEKSAA